MDWRNWSRALSGIEWFELKHCWVRQQLELAHQAGTTVPQQVQQKKYRDGIFKKASFWTGLACKQHNFHIFDICSVETEYPIAIPLAFFTSLSASLGLWAKFANANYELDWHMPKKILDEEALKRDFMLPRHCHSQWRFYLPHEGVWCCPIQNLTKLVLWFRVKVSVFQVVGVS